MSNNTPDPQESRKSRLDLLRERVGKDSEESPQQQPSPPAPTVSPQPPTQPVVPSQASVVQSAPMPIVATQGRAMPIIAPSGEVLMPVAQGVGQPSTHDRRSEVRFDMRNQKDNVQVDRRLWPAYAHYMSTVGRSKVDAFNRMILKVLLEAGYQIDPNILDRPFTYDDLPK